jgi:hypothetical protein
LNNNFKKIEEENNDLNQNIENNNNVTNEINNDITKIKEKLIIKEN